MDPASERARQEEQTEPLPLHTAARCPVCERLVVCEVEQGAVTTWLEGVCGHVWTPAPVVTVNSVGVPRVADVRRKSDVQAIRERVARRKTA